MRRVQIIGAGAVGLLVASFLAESKWDVQLVCRRQQQVNLLNGNLKRENDSGDFLEVNVKASTTICNDVDITIVALKSGQLQEIIHKLPKHIPTIFLQNGLAHYDLISTLSWHNVAFGSAQFGALKVADNVVSHRGIGVLKLAYIDEAVSGNFLKPLLDIGSENFPVLLEDNAERMLMEKAIYNSLINPLTALLHLKNGELLTNNHAYNLLKRIHTELAQCFPDESPSFGEVVALCERTAFNTSSMLSDHLMKKKSEAPAILGGLIERAEKKCVQLYTLTTIYELLLAKELQEEFII